MIYLNPNKPEVVERPSNPACDLKSMSMPDALKKLQTSPSGLSDIEAKKRLTQYGPNSMPDGSPHPARRAIEKLWAPVPWMLEAAIVLQLVLGKYVEAGVIGVLLLFNAALSFIQEGRAQATLAALFRRPISFLATSSSFRSAAWLPRMSG
jgi:H+-transporting ATPase